MMNPPAPWNIPKQTHFNDGVDVGDCWRCCIAAVIGLPADQVPHFLKESRAKGSSMDPETQLWLNARGLILVHSKEFHFPRWYGNNIPLPPVIACGPTERSRGMAKHHAVVMIADKMVYDPHPSDAGLTAVTDCYMVISASCHLRQAEVKS